MRGLKLAIREVCKKLQGVAPLAGAWIETKRETISLSRPVKVAPLAGAWIETSDDHHIDIAKESRTPRGCVDRNRFIVSPEDAEQVTPLVGATRKALL